MSSTHYIYVGGSLRSILAIFTGKCSWCIFRIIEADLKRSRQTKKKSTSHWAIFHPQRLIAIFPPKWPSAFQPPRSISVKQYWIPPKSRGWGTFGSPIRMSLRTLIGLRWSPPGGDGILSVWGQLIFFFYFHFYMPGLACYQKVWVRALYCPKMSL